MRADMNRLIIEDGRLGGGGPKTMYDKITRVGEEYENLPARESMSRHRKQDGNNSGDRLNPLRHYLSSQVGRPWSKVYSEICAVNDRRTIRGHHLLTHLWQYVRVGNPKDRYDWHFYQDFFVDRHGILRPAAKISQRQPVRERIARTPTTSFNLGDGWRYELIDGLWFKIRTRVEVVHYPAGFVERRGFSGVSYRYFRNAYDERNEVLEKKVSCGQKDLKVIRILLGRSQMKFSSSA